MIVTFALLVAIHVVKTVINKHTIYNEPCPVIEIDK